ncbi:histone H1E-like isoform X3 [Aethina tumida]|uniref:histone H1E-like isoform X3 n=1 Tax=Aethina tumida TaxID=116153 RepID=UPI00214747C5|nr:histone H1E-like isoform X3 [Aethina tumida]
MASQPPSTPRGPFIAPTAVMVTEALRELRKRKGSSLIAIKKYVLAHYNVNPRRITAFLKRHIKAKIANGELIRKTGRGTRGSFKLPHKAVKKTDDSETSGTAVLPKKRGRKPKVVVTTAAAIPSTSSAAPSSAKKSATEPVKKPDTNLAAKTGTKGAAKINNDSATASNTAIASTSAASLATASAGPSTDSTAGTSAVGNATNAPKKRGRKRNVTSDQMVAAGPSAGSSAGTSAVGNATTTPKKRGRKRNVTSDQTVAATANRRRIKKRKMARLRAKSSRIRLARGCKNKGAEFRRNLRVRFTALM